MIYQSRMGPKMAHSSVKHHFFRFISNKRNHHLFVAAHKVMLNKLLVKTTAFFHNPKNYH
jgi:hypothetical protein